MVRDIPKPATVEQTHSLGKWLDDNGHSPESVIEWLKAKHYVVKGIKYRADRVASFISGRISMRVEQVKPKQKSNRKSS